VGTPEEFGPYLVYERLGIGGMASVDRAEIGIAGFPRQIALKRLLPHVAANPEFVQLFVNEARLASHLHHTNVAQTYDFGMVGDDYFIAMEYVAGPTLMQVIRQCVAAAGQMPLPLAVHVLTGICDALDYAHNLRDETGKPLGLIHRDVSPSNVMISNAGLVKLIDFGIAKVTDSHIRTQIGTIKGKFGYIAPEYIGGQIDARSDLFGFGVIAYELLTNTRLFQVQDDLETLSRVRELAIAPPSRVNPRVTVDLDDIVMTALQRDPDRRWQSAAAARTALTNLSREIGDEVQGASVVDWLQWAFAQTPQRENSGLSALIELLEQPSAKAHPTDVVERRERDSVMFVLRKRPDSVAPPSSLTPTPAPVSAPPAAPAPATATAPTRSETTGVTVVPARPRRRSHLRILLLLLVLSLSLAAASIWYLGIPIAFR
jgi:serine/threonine protein kinase